MKKILKLLLCDLLNMHIWDDSGVKPFPGLCGSWCKICGKRIEHGSIYSRGRWFGFGDK